MMIMNITDSDCQGDVAVVWLYTGTDRNNMFHNNVDQITSKARNLLEEIICDSDLDYLGRSDFIPVSNTLFEEPSSE